MVDEQVGSGSSIRTYLRRALSLCPFFFFHSSSLPYYSWMYVWWSKEYTNMNMNTTRDHLHCNIHLNVLTNKSLAMFVNNRDKVVWNHRLCMCEIVSSNIGMIDNYQLIDDFNATELHIFSNSIILMMMLI